MEIKRNILLNPGPATTTDTVKMAQIVPDICPREREFADKMRKLRADLLKTVHADPEEYTSVLFCGSGTINIDVCLNSLLPEGKKILVIDNGAYSTRAADICVYYGLDHIDLKIPINEQPDLALVEKILADDPAIALVYTTHHETGTGLLNPIREIGALAQIRGDLRHGYDFFARDAPHRRKKGQCGLLHGVRAKGDHGDDGAFFHHRKEGGDRKIRGVSQAFLLLQPLSPICLF